MATQVAGALEIQLLADVARLQKDVAQMKGTLSGFSRDVDRMAGQMRLALGAIGAGLSTGAIVAMFKSVLDAGDAAVKASQKAGVGIEAWQKYAYAAKLAGVSSEQLGKGLKGLGDFANQVTIGSSEAVDMFKRLGVSVRDAGGQMKPTETLLLDMADRFQRMPDGLEKTTAATKVFGKAGMDLIPFLNQGRDGIEALLIEAERLGIVMDGPTAMAAEALNDNMARLSTSMRGMAVRAIAPLIPFLNQMAEGMAQSEVKGEGFRGTSEKITTGLRLMTSAALTVVATFEAIGNTLGGLAAAAQAFGSGEWGRIGGIFDAIKSDNALVLEKLGNDLGALWNTVQTEAPKAAQAMERLGATTIKSTESKKALADAEKLATAAAKAHNAEVERAIALDQQAQDAINSAIKDFRVGIEQMEFEVTLLGKTNAEREIAIRLRALEAAGIKLSGRELEEYTDRIRAAVDAGETYHAQQEAIRAQASVWNELSDVAGSFFSDLVMNGKSAFDNLKKWVKDLLAQMIALFAKRWVLNMAAGGSVLGAAGDALAGGSGAGSLVSSGLSLFSSGGTIAGAYGAFTAGAQGATLAAGLAGPTTVGATGAMGAGAAMSGVYSALAAIPVWGWIAMAVIGAIAFFSGRGGGPKPGGSFMADYDASGNFIGNSAVPGTDNGRFFTPTTGDSAMRDFTTQFATGFFDTLTRYGGTTGGLSFGFGFDQDPQGTADSRVSAMVRDANGNIVYSHTQSAGRDDEDFQRALSLETQRALLAGLQASDLPESIALIFDGLDPLTATAEQLAQAFKDADLGMAILALNITGLDFQTLQNFQAHGETLEQTFQRVGGAWAWFQENFTTDAERLTRAQTQVTDTFASLGIAVPASLTDFRLLVEGIDLSTEAGRTLWTTLMGVAPAFLLVDQSAGAATEAVEEFNDAVVMTADLSARIAEDVRRSRESQLDSVIGARGGLQDFLNGVRLDSNLTTLDPMARLAEARRQYEEVLGLAQGGDLGAAGRLGGSAQTYLQIAREMFASSGAYVDIFNRVTGDVEGVDARLEVQQHILEATLGMAYTMTEVRDLLIDIRDGGTAGDAKVAKSVDNSALALARR